MPYTNDTGLSFFSKLKSSFCSLRRLDPLRNPYVLVPSLPLPVFCASPATVPKPKTPQTGSWRCHKKAKSRSKFQIVAGAQFPVTIFASTYVDAKIFHFSS
jgi:hypothetical protein